MKITFITEGVSGGTDTNTNVANDDLTLDGDHTTDVSNSNLTFDNGGTNIMQLNGTSTALLIGGASPYTMPTSRAAAQYDVLTATNASGGTSFETPQIEGGKAMMLMSGGIGTFDAGNYAWFKKQGAAMHNDTNLTFGASTACALEMLVWDGKMIPTSYRIAALRDAGDATNGVTFSIYYGAISGSNVVLTKEQTIADLLVENTTDWQTTDGTIVAGDFENASEGDWFTFGLQCGDVGLSTVQCIVTVYFSPLVKY